MLQTTRMFCSGALPPGGKSSTWLTERQTLLLLHTTGVVTFAGVAPDLTGDEYGRGMAVEVGSDKYTINSISSAGVATVKPAPAAAVVAMQNYRITNPSRRKGPFAAVIRSGDVFELSSESQLERTLELTAPFASAQVDSAMSAKKKASSDSEMLEAIRGITDKDVVVVVDGVDITLQVPDLVDAKALRTIALGFGKEKEDDPKALASGAMEMGIHAVAACIPGLDLETAGKLLLISGGEMGELARAAMSLCGIGSGFSGVG